jgi:putative acetyltransferase
MRILPADLSDPRIVRLLETHTMRARAETGRGSAHALDLDGLRVPEIDVWGAWEGEDLLGVAALKRLSSGHGEIKSMHVAQARRRSGAGRALMEHLIEEGRRRGLERLSLETGSWPYFEPARAFYARCGFVECGPFEGYGPDPNSVFMTRAL